MTFVVDTKSERRLFVSISSILGELREPKVKRGIARRMNVPVAIIFLLANTLQVSSELPFEDATAIVNQLFTYRIDPADINHHSKITEAGKDTLPSWLHYDSSLHELSGVPTVKDKGTYVLSVGKELFAITVTDATKSQVAEPLEQVEQTICKPQESITVVYVKLNKDVDQLATDHKVRLVRSISTHLSLKPNYISLVARPKDLMDSSAALVAGPGDAAAGETLSTLSWIVGCGAVKSHHMDVLESLESSAKNGALSKILNIPISGWQVQSNQQIIKNRRLKRDVRVTNTPVPVTSTERTSPAATTVRPTTTATQPTIPTTPTTVTQATTRATTTVATAVPATTKPSTTPTTTTVRTTPSTTKTTTKASTTASTTIPTKPEVVNKKPEVNMSLVPHLAATYHHLFKWKIPAALFNDPEGGLMTLALEDPVTGNLVRRLEPWFVQKSKDSAGWEMLGIASPGRDVNKKTMNLRATDDKGNSAVVPISIHIRDDQTDNRTEIYTITLKPTPALRAGDGHIYIVKTLSHHLHTQKMVLSMVANAADSITVTFGDNRGRQTVCPLSENREVERKLRLMLNRPIAVVGGDNLGSLEVTAIKTLKPLLPCKDEAPMANADKMRQFEKISVPKGELLDLKLPDYLITDREDGALSNLKVRVLVDGLQECKGWICWDDSLKSLQGLSWHQVSPVQITIIVTDSANNVFEKEIDAEVSESQSQPTHVFTLKLDEDYSIFANNLAKQIALYKSINSAFPGKSIHIIDIKSGSVVIQFRVQDNSVNAKHGDDCPTAELNNYKNAAISNDAISQQFSSKFSQFNIERLDFAPEGVCEGKVQPFSAMSKKTEKGEAIETKSASLPIIVAVIVVVVVVIIVVAVVVVILKKRKAQERRMQSGYIEKGVPVVLEGEMKDMDQPEQQPLMSHDVHFKSTPKPPAYPNNEKRSDGYQPPTPPASEPDEHTDRSL